MAPFATIDRPSPFARGGEGLPVHVLTPDLLEAGGLEPQVAAFAQAAGFKAESGGLLLLPGADGALKGALFGLGADSAPFVTGKLARSLPKGRWRLVGEAVPADAAALGFGLGSYRFDRYKANGAEQPVLVLPEGVDEADLARRLAGVTLARDLINAPTNDMGPEALEAVVRALAHHYGATVTTIAGDDLLSQNFPLIHTVGRAAAEAPRLLDLRWRGGRRGGPGGGRRITLVGKGVCFDTGGLDIKPAASMLLMKKDMGGAANVMGLALMIMDAGLDVDLRVLLPIVENSIAGNAFRPGDIYRSRKGLTVQIDNTDAEGRLILADALALADEEETDLIVDMATLTGAARVALGPDLPPFFTDDEALAVRLTEASLSVADPLWRLPLFKGYEKDVTAKVADLTNAPAGGMAGAITAALFLKRFVERAPRWVHLDIFGWSPSERAHAPVVGGEGQGIRALYQLIRDGL